MKAENLGRATPAIGMQSSIVRMVSFVCRSVPS